MCFPWEWADRTLDPNILATRIEPGALDQALNEWNQAWGAPDDALAMDGKTMKNALDEEGRQTHIMSVAGHEWKRSYAQKK